MNAQEASREVLRELSIKAQGVQNLPNFLFLITFFWTLWKNFSIMSKRSLTVLRTRLMTPSILSTALYQELAFGEQWLMDTWRNVLPANVCLSKFRKRRKRKCELPCEASLLEKPRKFLRISCSLPWCHITNFGTGILINCDCC